MEGQLRERNLRTMRKAIDRLFKAKAAHEGVERLANPSAEDAVKMKRREVGDPGEVVETKRLRAVGGNVVDHGVHSASIDAQGVVSAARPGFGLWAGRHLGKRAELGSDNF